LALAREWYVKAANLGLPKAVAHLGQLSENGKAGIAVRK
jgi:TPR repeat protein